MSNLIQENSKVILYLGYNNLHVIKVKANEVYQTKFGALKHNDLIGKEFGSKIICTKGYIHALPIVPGKGDRRYCVFVRKSIFRIMDTCITASNTDSLHG